MVTILHAPYFTIFFTIMKAEAILLNYISTRGGMEKLSSAEAILQGLSGNGGLFVPEEIPTVSEAFIEGLVPLTYEERAVRVLKEFLTDYGEDEIRGCVTRAYGGAKFDSERRAPTRLLQDRSVLELWHGPTSAFKDMALQLLPQLMPRSQASRMCRRRRSWCSIPRAASARSSSSRW